MKWNFPSNNDGTAHALNDSGIETFKDNPFKSLAREIPQNSCDAKKGDDPVRVEFSLLEVPRTQVPNVDGLVEIISSCLNHWRD